MKQAGWGSGSDEWVVHRTDSQKTGRVCAYPLSIRPNELVLRPLSILSGLQLSKFFQYGLPQRYGSATSRPCKLTAAVTMYNNVLFVCSFQTRWLIGHSGSQIKTTLALLEMFATSLTVNSYCWPDICYFSRASVFFQHLNVRQLIVSNRFKILVALRSRWWRKHWKCAPKRS